MGAQCSQIGSRARSSSVPSRFVRSIDLADAYRTMLVMRRFEETVGAAVASGEIHGEMHLGIGQEAVSVALSFLLRPADAVVSTHRPHLHALALGVDPVLMLGELLEREGLCRGKGGHMHLFDLDTQFMCTGIVGAGAPQAAGYALAQRRAGTGAVTVAVVGDGAMNQGAVLETLNLAALWRLPMVFLVEDNGYGISVPRDVASAGPLVKRGEPFGIPGEACDGTDPIACLAALEPAFARARRGDGPAVVVASVYRFSGHYEGDADTYRSQQEKDEAMSDTRDPLSLLRARSSADGADDATLAAIERHAAATVASWFEAARSLPFPDVAQVREDVYT
jgi:acetoin:2,6-dichlorophenolindophenol oxidoreductase subunit alpha